MSCRKGAVLLEVLIAVTVLATAGLALARHVAEAMRALEHASAQERELRAADRLVSAVSLWSRGELDARLGTRSQGDFRLEIQRADRNLYVVTLRDSTDERQLLRTMISPAEDSVRVR